MEAWKVGGSRCKHREERCSSQRAERGSGDSAFLWTPKSFRQLIPYLGSLGPPPTTAMQRHPTLKTKLSFFLSRPLLRRSAAMTLICSSAEDERGWILQGRCSLWKVLASPFLPQVKAYSAVESGCQRHTPLCTAYHLVNVSKPWVPHLPAHWPSRN